MNPAAAARRLNSGSNVDHVDVCDLKRPSARSLSRNARTFALTISVSGGMLVLLS